MFCPPVLINITMIITTKLCALVHHDAAQCRCI